MIISVTHPLIWGHSKLSIVELFDVKVNTINYHLKEIFKTKELDEDPTIRKIRIVQKEVIDRFLL